jgi:hypothetical protein
MEGYKLRIFVRAIKSRMELENKTAEEIIVDYVKLTDEEKENILIEVNK